MKLNGSHILRNYGWIAVLVCIPVVVIAIFSRGEGIRGNVISTTRLGTLVSWYYQPTTIDRSAQEEDRGRVLKAGQRVRVVMKDGQSFTGEFLSKDRLNVVITIAGIRTTFDQEKVDHVVALKSFEEEYRDLKKTLDPDDYAQRSDLCRWLYGRGEYELAAQELEALLDDTSQFPEARQLLRTVNKAIELHSSTTDRDGSKVPETNDSSVQPSQFVSATLLTDSDVNLMRIYEVDLKDPPRMIVPREVIDELFKKYGQSEMLPQTEEGRRRFYSKKPSEILDILFELQARELYGKIRVLSEPKAFMRFRLDVERIWLTNTCATSRCHGGVNGGKFYLFNKRTNDSRTVYTNFLILERIKIGGKPLLNYDKPSESLLLQMGLPRNQTGTPHPLVDGWRPVFRDRADPLFQKAEGWMNGMYRPRPDYPVNYVLPKIGHRGEATDGGGDGEVGESTGSASDDKDGGGL